MPLLRALERMLDAHMPWPAMATDREWRPLRTNRAFDALVTVLCRHARSAPDGRGMMEWLFAPDGLRPLVANFDTVGPFLLERVRHEAVVDPGLEDLLGRLEQAATDAAIDHAVEPDQQGVVLPLQLHVDGRSVQLFSLLAAFGSPLDAGLQDLRIEYFCPLDEASARWLAGLTPDASRPGRAQASARGPA